MWVLLHAKDYRQLTRLTVFVRAIMRPVEVLVLSTGRSFMTKHIFVTGGVVSSLGKGITAASLGRLLKSRGYKVMMQKADPYLNVDPGTMSPFQHGEVFVTEEAKRLTLTWVIMSALSMKTLRVLPTLRPVLFINR